MSDFKLDIDYPYTVIQKDKLVTKPDSVLYPRTRIRYRHHGRTIDAYSEGLRNFPKEMKS